MLDLNLCEFMEAVLNGTKRGEITWHRSDDHNLVRSCGNVYLEYEFPPHFKVQLELRASRDGSHKAATLVLVYPVNQLVMRYDLAGLPKTLKKTGEVLSMIA